MKIASRVTGTGLFLLVMLFGAAAMAQHLELEKSNFAPGQEIRVRFTASGQYADNAWVGIIPAHVRHGSEAENDKYDLAYQYLKKRTSGVLIFRAPTKTGAYDFRMHNTDNNGREVASVSFRVGAATAPAVLGPLRLEKGNFRPGEEIRVHFTASARYADNAWVGIIPSNIRHGSEAENDKYDLAYQYLKKRTSGVLIFRAPSKSGSFDFRMHDTDKNGREVASVTFRVGSSSAPVASGPLRLDKGNFRPGEEIRVHFTASARYADNAWVGIIPSNIRHGSEAENDKYDLAYQYLKKRTSGVLIFRAPSKSGSFDFRMHDTDKNGREVASVSFRVSN